MNTARSITFCMLLALAGLFLALCTNCATTQPQRQRLYQEVSVASPTRLLTGPARGHWAEQDEHPVMVYTVMGTECEYLAAQLSAPAYEARGTFLLAPGITLCAIPLRGQQTVLVHAERL